MLLGNRNTMCSLLFAVLMQFLFIAHVYADPAPVITSFDIIAVCTGNDVDASQCVDVSSSPYFVSVSGNGKLFVVTQQRGYASNQEATFRGSAVRSVKTTFIYSPYPIVSGFVDYWDCGSFQSGSFTATVTSITNYRDWTATTYVSKNPILNVTLLGSGSGTITADTGALSWIGNVGTANYVVDTPITLMAIGSAGSTFDGWSGACTNASGDCAITMSADKSVSATFTVIPNSRIGSTPYGTLTNAYNAVATSEIIEAKDMTFVENLTLSRDIPFTLRGGYADDYGSRTGFTILNGVLTISSGSMIVDSLIIR